MNESKLNQLFTAARQETPPSPAPGFENLVLAAMRHDATPVTPAELSWLEQITAWSPRLVIGCAILIAACITTDVALNSFGLPTLTDGVAQISGDWLLTPNSI